MLDLFDTNSYIFIAAAIIQVPFLLYYQSRPILFLTKGKFIDLVNIVQLVTDRLQSLRLPALFHVHVLHRYNFIVSVLILYIILGVVTQKLILFLAVLLH
jgi:hypothetical protein